MKTVWSEWDEALLSRARRRAVWFEPEEEGVDLLRRFIEQAQNCAQHYEDAAEAQREFDYQLSQFVRCYVQWHDGVGGEQ